VILKLEFVKMATVVFSLPTGNLEFSAHAVKGGPKFNPFTTYPSI